MMTQSDTFAHADAGFQLTPEDVANIKRRMLEARMEARRWLSLRYNNVRDEEISERVADAIKTIIEWEQDCYKCTDITRCRHSRAILVISQEYGRDGVREFVVRARPCDRLNQYHNESAAEHVRGRADLD